MGLFKKAGRRGVMKAGLASLTAVTALKPDAHAALRPKAPGETKIVALFGNDEDPCGIGHEIHVRSLFKSKKDWRLIFVRANKYFTPELISDADLLITSSNGSAEPIDLFTADAGMADSIAQGVVLWTDTNVKAVMDNVMNRGMGLLALNNTICAGNRRFVDFLDVKEIQPHDYEPLWIRRLNQNHPITQGVGKFCISHDKQYAVLIKSSTTATLFETTAVHEKRQGISGWALERGKGRIAGLLPGSTIHAYQAPEYCNIVWRAAHWAMNRDIQPYPDAHNTLYE